MNHFHLFIITVATTCALDGVESARILPQDSVNFQLFKYLFHDGYEPSIRPIAHTGQPTIVTVSPNLYSIIGVTEEDQTLTFSRWFQMFWKDPHLEWDPAEFNGTMELLVDVKNIWVPDITIIEMLSTDNAATVIDFASLSYDGTVRYSMNDIITVYCSIDAASFPYDNQTCTISYVSWEYPANQIKVEPVPSASSNLLFYGESSEWDLDSYEHHKPPVITDNVTISFDSVTYVIKFRRKPTFYVLALVLPSFLITTLSIIGLFSPSTSENERQERISIGLNATLAMSVVLMILTDIMPKSNSFPLIGQYTLAEMVITSVAVLLACAIMYLQASASVDVDLPWWLLKITFVTIPKKVMVAGETNQSRKSSPKRIDLKMSNTEADSKQTERNLPNGHITSVNLGQSAKSTQSSVRHQMSSISEMSNVKPPQYGNRAKTNSEFIAVAFNDDERRTVTDTDDHISTFSDSKSQSQESFGWWDKAKSVAPKGARMKPGPQTATNEFNMKVTEIVVEIHRILRKFEEDLADREIEKIRLDTAIKVCWRLDIVFNILFNLFNISVTIFYFVG